MSETSMPPTPWYRQFWPWFLIALPGTVVVASLITVYIAFKNADDLVRDDYYREGLAINQEFAQDRRAAELGISAEISFDDITGEVVATVNGLDGKTERLLLQLLHPMDETRDKNIDLLLLHKGFFRGDLGVVPSSRYYLRLSSPTAPEWRLSGEITPNTSLRVLLTPDA